MSLEIKQATPLMVENISEFFQVRARLKTDSVREEELAILIKDYVGNKACAIKHNGTLLAMIQDGVWSGINYDLLKTLYPEAATACKKSKPFLAIKCP